jgi:thioredoxin 1
MMEPIFEELKAEFKEVEFEEINVDEHPDVSSARGVMSIPTYILEKNGKEVGRKVGYTPKAEMVKLLQA